MVNLRDLYGNNRIEAIGTVVMLEAINKNIVRLFERK